MTYSEKVKKASTILNAINSLSDDQSIGIVYKGETYKVKAYKSYDDKLSYSVWSGYNGMNVSKVGKTSMDLYSYDMMRQRTTYRMSLLDCSILPELEPIKEV